MRSIRLLRNIASNYMSMAIGLLVGVVLTPIMVYGLGDADYGLWVAIFALTGYFGLFDRGIRPSLVRYVSKYKANEDADALSSTIGAALTLYTGAGLLTALVTLLVAWQFPVWFNIDVAQAETARIVVLLGGATLALGFPMGVFGATLSGLQRYDIANGIGIAVSILRLALFVTILKTGGGMIELAACSLGLNLMGHILSYTQVRRLLPDVRIRVLYFNREYLKRIGSYSSIAFIGALSTMIAFQTDALVITAFMGAAWVTPFALAATLVNHARSLVHGAVWVMAPTASELDTRGEKQPLEQMLMQGSRYAVLVSWPVLMAFVIFGGNLLTTWVGERFATSAGILALLAIPTMIALPQSAASSVLYGVGRHRGVVALSVTNAITNVALSLWLVQTHGIVGVAWGTAIPLFLINGVATIVYVCRALKIPLRTYLWIGMIRPGLVSLTFAVPALIAEMLWHPVGWVPLGATTFGCWLIFLSVVWHFALTQRERDRWIRTVPSALGLNRDARPEGSTP